MYRYARRWASGLGGLKIGGSVKAHRTKADLTELIVAYPIRLSK